MVTKVAVEVEYQAYFAQADKGKVWTHTHILLSKFLPEDYYIA